jgi:hypothetical protein
MKKHTKIRRLTLQRHTVTALLLARGGAPDTSLPPDLQAISDPSCANPKACKPATR